MQPEIPRRFRLPDCPVYWSLDPSGADHLSMEEAEQLGFPIFTIEMEVRGWSWNKSVYTGIRQFHRANGFDPDSQEVARMLGYPLYEISKEQDGSFAHVEEIWDEPSEIHKVPDSFTLQEVVHAESGPDLSPTQKGALPVNNAAIVALPNHWKIIIGMQFALLLALGAVRLRDRFH
ncbi:hypothetical protein B0H17DRAFT_34891 [Mycena rosella]|uniref:Uncharacterized protein n=1 Tax=Mycena rosella TaxID=1033263 RepID=A0AAD7B158_MYCRO|nr:hypothetical protein B0H17DRAFT_34891 [Mycena rosella]